MNTNTLDHCAHCELLNDHATCIYPACIPGGKPLPEATPRYEVNLGHMWQPTTRERMVRILRLSYLDLGQAMRCLHADEIVATPFNRYRRA